MFTPENITALMKEYNEHIDRCAEIKAQVVEWTNQWMSQYDTSSVQPEELTEVFFTNTWCLPDALEQNLEFVDKWCPKAEQKEVIIDGEFREIDSDVEEQDEYDDTIRE